LVFLRTSFAKLVATKVANNHFLLWAHTWTLSVLHQHKYVRIRTGRTR